MWLLSTKCMQRWVIENVRDRKCQGKRRAVLEKKGGLDSL